MGLKFLEKDELIPYLAETLEKYRQVGIGLLTDLYKEGKSPAVLVVDLQKGFTSPYSPLGTKGVSEEVLQVVNSTVENTRTLLNVARKKGLPIIYIISVFREDGKDGGCVGEKSPILLEYFKRGSKWVEVDKRVRPKKEDYIIEKKVSSGFIGTPLLQILKLNQVDTCIITGISISACVRQTTVDAVSYGYYAVLPEECVGDRGVGPGKASLFDIMTKFADVASLEDVINWINSLN